MPELNRYKLTLPVTQIRVSDTQLTFMIEHIKCRKPIVAYFKFYGYDLEDNLICEHTGERWAIATEYTMQYETFDVPAPVTDTDFYNELDHYQIELYFIGADSENPVFFNHLMLNEGELMDYHIPDEEIKNVTVGFAENKYINLYDDSETFLQIIRPVGEDLTTNQLSKSQTTILAPHLPNESTFDDPVALFYEYMYMTDQIIGVEK